MADLPPDWQPLVDLGNSGSPWLCVVLSPLWGALHYFPLPLQSIHTFLSHSFQASPIQKHFITVLLLLTCFLVPICLNGSITLILKVQASVCKCRNWCFLDFPYSSDIYWKSQHFLTLWSQRRHQSTAFDCLSLIRSQRISLRLSVQVGHKLNAMFSHQYQQYFHNHMRSQSAYVKGILMIRADCNFYTHAMEI